MSEITPAESAAIPGAATAAFLSPGLKSIFPSADRFRSLALLGGAAAGAMLACATLRHDPDLTARSVAAAGTAYARFVAMDRNDLFDYVDERLGPTADFVEAGVDSAGEFAAAQAARIRRGLQRAVEAVDRRFNPETYDGDDLSLLTQASSMASASDLTGTVTAVSSVRPQQGHRALVPPMPARPKTRRTPQSRHDGASGPGMRR
jgi:hypothetical protein